MNILLNVLPVEFSRTDLPIWTIQYKDRDHLESLRAAHAGEFLFSRAGRLVEIAALRAGNTYADAQGSVVRLRDKPRLFRRLLEEGLRSHLTTDASTRVVSQSGPLRVTAVGPANDLVQQALRDDLALAKRSGFLSIFRRYRLSGEYFRMGDGLDPVFGILLHLNTLWRINVSLAELTSSGVDLRGCEVIPLSALSDDSGPGHWAVGRVAAVAADRVSLDGARDVSVVSAANHTVDASLDSVNRIAGKLLGAQASGALSRIRREVSQLLSAPGQQDKIAQVAKSLASRQIPCAAGLTASVSETLATAEAVGAVVRTTTPPKYVLKYGRAPATGPIARALAASGPFDQDSFKKPIPHILVVVPKQYLGQAEQFFRTWREGRVRAYAKGFQEQYRLRDCQFHFVDFEEETGNPGGSYHGACIRALQQSRDMVKRYDLAFVLVKDEHRWLGAEDPYIVSKAALMGAGVPVQEVRVATLNTSPSSLPYVLNNIALASYAKLGGTPWTIAARRGEGITHELILGISSVALEGDVPYTRQRFVGVTTLFNYDGVYLTSNLSQEARYEEYPELLLSSLESTVRQVGARKGWASGDRVRLVFHTAKLLKYAEADAARSLVDQLLPEYQVDFAFLQIGQQHPWMAYDTDSQGSSRRSGCVGAGVPWRGTSVEFGDRQALVTLVGPKELKNDQQGCPSPVQVKLHRSSTFADLGYLVDQVYNFTYMSWKKFNLGALPVTITYSQAVARLLGRLRGVPNWNADVLRTTELRSSLWFL